MRKFMAVLLISCIVMLPLLSNKGGTNPTGDIIEQGIFIGLVVMTLGLMLTLVAFFFEKGNGITGLWVSVSGVIIHIFGLGIYVFYVYPI